MYGAGDVRVVEVPDPVLAADTDAIIRVVRACVCGSDLWPYREMPSGGPAQAMGHEAIGVVEETGAGVHGVQRGDLVVMPMFSTDGTCEFCREGTLSGCAHVGFFGRAGAAGAQAEAVRVPYADATLVRAGAETGDDEVLRSLATLSDVMATGHHAAVTAGVRPGHTVAVIGDGAVGLCGVIAARRLGAERVIVLGRHRTRTDLARDLGATDVVAERGAEAVERVRELTGGTGAHAVLECVGTEESTATAIEIARPGGGVGRVGVPHYPAVPQAVAAWVKNLHFGGGPAPVRAYLDELLPDVLNGTIRPGRVFDRTTSLDGVPDGYRAMAAREAIKVLVTP